MASLMPSLDNISWERIAREDAVTYPADAPDQPGRDVVFEKGFPRPGGFGKLVAAKLTPPAETPDVEYPFILTTGRQPRALAHRRDDAAGHPCSTRSSLRRSLRSRAAPSPSSAWRPGDMVRVTTRAAPSSSWPAGRRRAGRRRVHPVRLCGGSRQPAHQSGARSVRQRFRVQVLRRAGRAGLRRPRAAEWDIAAIRGSNGGDWARRPASAE